MTRWGTLLIVVGLMLVTASQAVAESRHSGTVAGVSQKGEVTLEEMGPWNPARTVVAKRSIVVTPDTKVSLAVRSGKNEAASEADWPGGFKEASVGVTDIKPGDFATVIGEEKNGRVVASKIIVVRPENESVPAASPALPPQPEKSKE